MKIEEIPQIIRNEIKNNLENGILEEDVGQLSGSSKSTYFRWKKEVKGFDEFCEKAILTYKKKLINAVNLGTIKDGKLALEMLERRWPDQWKGKTVNLNIFNKEDVSW